MLPRIRQRTRFKDRAVPTGDEKQKACVLMVSPAVRDFLKLDRGIRSKIHKLSTRDSISPASVDSAMSPRLSVDETALCHPTISYDFVR